MISPPKAAATWSAGYGTIKLVPDWLPPFLVASLAILLLNLALFGQRRRERRSRWDRRLLRELRAWDGRVPDALNRPRRLR